MLRGLLLILLVSILLSGAAFALGGYNLSWWTVDGGGEESTGGDYTLVGTIGQADAGSMAGDGYLINGGFWPGGAGSKVYLALVVR